MAVELGKGNGYTELGHMYGAPDGTYPGIKHSNDKAQENYLKSYETNTPKEADFKGSRYAGDLYDVGHTHDDGSIAASDYVKAVSDKNIHATMLGIPQEYLSLS